MTRMKRGSGKRAAITPARGEGKGGGEREAERYAGAFARAKLVRAWIAVAAAMVAMLYAYVAFLERLERWWASFPSRFRARLPTRMITVRTTILAMGLLALGVPQPLQADGRRPANRLPTARSRFSYVTITHSGNGSASIYTNASGSTTFTVQNDGSPLTALLSVSNCTGNISCGSASPAAGYLGTGNLMPVTVSFTGGMTPGSGSFRLVARDASDNSVMNYYDVSVTVSVDPNAPTLSFTPHVGDRRNVSQCVADCFESTFSYTTPAYISLDVPRSATLLYRSGSAYPHGKLTLDASSANAPAGSTFRLQRLDQNGTNVTFTNNAQALYFSRNASGATRIVAQFDATQIPTSARLYTAYVSTIRPDGSVFGSKTDTVRIVVINDRNSPYGAGVSLVGIQRIWFNQSGGVLVTDGTGSATFFAGSCNVNTTCSYTSPSGEFSTFSTSDGFFYRDYPDGTRLSFYGGGHHRGTWDRFGNATYVDYGWNGSDYVPTVITDPTGQTIALNYHNASSAGTTYLVGSLGQISIQQGARLSNFGVMPSGNLEYLVDADGFCCAVATYDAQHRLSQYNTNRGLVSGFAYRYGATLDYSEVSAIALAGNTTGSPRVTVRNAADALLTAGAVSGAGSSANPLAVATDLRALVIGPRNDSTFFSLNRFGAPRKTYAPLTPSDSVEYNDLTGQVTRTISPTGMDVHYTWNAHKLMKVQNVTLGTQDSIVYTTQFSLPQQTISSTSAWQWFTYDSTKTGWPLKYARLGSPSASPTTHYTDGRGRDTAFVDPVGHRTTWYYAASGLLNLDSTRTPNGQVSRVGRDTWGRVVSTRNPYGARDSTSLDVFNRPTWVAGPLYNDTTRYQYDALNNVTSVTDAKNQVYTYQRNALGWVTKLTHPGTLGSDSTAYDIAGNPVYARTRAGRQVALEYDLLGRLKKKRSLATNDSITFTYDPAGRWVEAKSVVGGSTVVSTDTIFTDSLGRTIKERTVRPSLAYWDVASDYNTTNAARAGVYVAKNGTGDYSYSFQYDGLQRPSYITIQNYLSTRFTYNSDQQRDTIVYPSYYGGSLRETWEYTPDHALARRSYNVTAVQSVLDRAYRSDSLGRLVERAVGTTGRFQNFSYDIGDRLAYWIKKHETGTPNCVNTVGGWGYDCSGPGVLTDSVKNFLYDNVQNPDDPGTTVGQGNRLTAFNGVTSMTYDADGNLATKGTDTYAWDDFGQLTSVTRNGTLLATFAYDGFGRRVRKWTSTGGTTHYIWDGDQIILETDGSGVTTQAYSYQPGTDRLHAVTTGSGQTYYASIEPATGDVNGLIRASDNAVVAQYAYSPWGELEVDSTNIGNSLRWKGLVYDRETELYYIRARYYDPKLRRFISEDPIGLQGGINEYVFAGGDPINNSDPSGRDCVTTYVPGSLITTKSNGQEIVVGASDGYYTITCIEQTAHRGGNGYVGNGMVTGEVANGYDEAGQVAINLYAKHLPSACVLSAAQFGAGVGIDTYAALEGGEGIIAGLQAAKSYLRIYTGNFVRKLGGAFAAVVQKQLARAATAHLISANNAFFGSDGMFSQWAQSANSPLAGETTGSSWIPFTGPHIERWKTANENCQE